MLINKNGARTGIDNGAVVRRLMNEAFALGDGHMLNEIIAPDYIGHLAIGDHYGPEGVRIDIASYHAAFAGFSVRLDDLIAEGDQVARRFMMGGTHVAPFLGDQPTGRSVTFRGIAIDRLMHGQLVESWINVMMIDAACVDPAR